MKKYVMLLTVVLTVSSWCMATVIDDFESYTSTLGLKGEWTNTANLTITLDTAVVHSGTKSMKYAYNCGASPYYAKSERRLDTIEWGVTSEDWTTAGSVLSFWYKVTAKKEPLHIKVVDTYGTQAYDWNLGTVPVGEWVNATLDLNALANSGTLTAAQLFSLQHVGRLDIVMIASSYGSGVINFDDFTIPEPATMVILGLGSLLLRKRK